MHQARERVVINVGYALIGEELEFAKELHIEIVDGVITHIGKGYLGNAIDYRNSIAIPAPVNAHLHILDYAFLDYETGTLNLRDLVAEPNGLKHRLLNAMSEKNVVHACRSVFKKLRKSGVTAAIAFIELPWTATIVRRIAKDHGINAIILGRPRANVTVEKVLELFDGLGLDSPLRYSEEELTKMKSLCKLSGKVLSTHIAETANARAKGDFEIAARYLDPDLWVHCTHLSEEDIAELAEKQKTIVACPRSNMLLGVGIPRLKSFIESKLNVLLGTDNAGFVEPDIWRELEIAYDILRLSGLAVDPREVLKMATVNVEKIPGLGIENAIAEGRKANLVLLDATEISLEASHNIYASIVKRGSSTYIVDVINYSGFT